jgi:hypothetical protein
MSAAVVAMKTPAATAMVGTKTNNNQLKAVCRRPTGMAGEKINNNHLKAACRRGHAVLSFERINQLVW